MTHRLLAGPNPVSAALDRGDRLVRITVASGDVGPRLRAILGRANDAGVEVRRADRRQLDRLAGGANHQGVLAEAPPFAYASLDEIAQSLAKAGDSGLVLALDGVQDPHNLGAVIRSAAAFGAQGVVIPLHGACEVTLAAERASAGAASRVPVARVTNLAKALDHLKQSADAWVATADARGGQDPARAQPPRPLVLVLGSEAKGVRPNVAKRADLSLTLPVADAVESLNISVAAAVLMYALRTT